MLLIEALSIAISHSLLKLICIGQRQPFVQQFIIKDVSVLCHCIGTQWHYDYRDVLQNQNNGYFDYTAIDIIQI